ncbi:hypothetical protein BCAR13_650008 [Paraburkholderia caribensis]|nr:hypothetical protein BCAR13_650008 [Paraburkholderia caribensis]
MITRQSLQKSRTSTRRFASVLARALPAVEKTGSAAGELRSPKRRRAPWSVTRSSRRLGASREEIVGTVSAEGIDIGQRLRASAFM